VYVLEAVSKGVSLTPLDRFLLRSNKVAIARLNTKLNSRINAAMTYGKTLLNYPYDDIYVMGDSTYYCSELIYEMFVNTGDSTEVFQLNPMTFKDNQSSEYLPFWVEYYKNLGVEIPEGKPGLNPNGMFQSSNIEIVFPYGILQQH
jgi:hypothetical protein